MDREEIDAVECLSLATVVQVGTYPLFLMGTVALYKICSTGLRQTEGSPSFCLFRLI